MKLYCAICGRSMAQAAVMIGQEPIGPKCARRAGLLAAPSRSGRVRLLASVRSAGDRSRNLDLFEVAA